MCDDGHEATRLQCGAALLFDIVNIELSDRRAQSRARNTTENRMLQVIKADLGDTITPEPKTVDKIRTVYPRIKATADSAVTHVMDQGMSFDFEGVAISQLYRLAVKQLVIDVQAEFRKAKMAEQDDASNWEKVWSVKEMLEKSRTPATTAKKAETNLDKLTQEERMVLFAKSNRGE